MTPRPQRVPSPACCSASPERVCAGFIVVLRGHPQAVLHRVVTEVFGDTEVTWEDDERETPHVHCVRLSARVSSDDRERNAALCASYEWFEAHLLDLEVGTISFDYDDDESEKEAEMRDLARIVRAYPQGEGEVTYRPTLFRRRLLPTLTFDMDGTRWHFRGRTSWRSPL
jgi:hypothetical protein